MRRLALVVPAVTLWALVGCESSSFLHDGVLHAETRGVVLHDDGESGQAGMFDTTCKVYSGGYVGEDVDYPGAGEEVQDIGLMNGESVVLIRSDIGVHVQSPLGDWFDDDHGGAVDIQIADLREARVLDHGVVTLEGGPDGCSVSWHNDDPSSTPVPGALCGGAFDADPTTGTAWVASGSSVVQVTPAGVVEIGDGELLAWDATANVLYVAEQGGIEVRALEADGTIRWAVELNGSVASLSDMGVRGAALVSARTYSDNGRLYVLDGATGEILESRDTPDAGQELATSADGRRVAVVLPGAVHFLQSF